MRIDIEGYVVVRPMSCHMCPGDSGCWRGAVDVSTQDANHYPDCTDGMCGAGVLREVKKLTDASVPETRDQLKKDGRKMAATVKDGDIIAVEVDDVNEPWILGRAVIKGRAKGPRKAKSKVDEVDNWMGKIKKGDLVIDVIKLEPIAPGCRFFQYPDQTRMSAKAFKAKHFAVFEEDIRRIDIDLIHVEPTRRSSRLERQQETDFDGQYDKWEMRAEDRVAVLELLPKYGAPN